MSKELEALSEMFKNLNAYTRTRQAVEEFRNIEKSLKALEIIKTKKVNCYLIISYFKYYNYEKYVKDVDGDYDTSPLSDELLTQEEYELVKEVLIKGE